MALARGKIWQAFYIQPAAAFLCSVLVVIGSLCFLIAVFGLYFSLFDRIFSEIKIRHVVIALIVIIAAGWAVTLSRALIGSTYP